MGSNLIVKDARFKKLLTRLLNAAELPLAALGLIYLVVYSVQVTNRSNLELVDALDYVSAIIWFAFLADTLFKFIDAENWGSFFKRCWFEIICVAIPFVRFLRAFRIILAVRGLRGFLKNRANETGAYIAMLVPLVWFSGGVALLDAESSAEGATITDLYSALWVSLQTVSTLGYGQYYPVTFEGRAVASVLMIAGIALFSAGAGIFASWILGGSKSPKSNAEE